MITGESLSALTGEPVHEVLTDAAVAAGVGQAFVHVLVAVLAGPASVASALVAAGLKKDNIQSII